MLKDTSRLRYHRAEYVRALAAQSVGYLLRQAPKAQLRTAVKVVLRQQAVHPTPERTHVSAFSTQSTRITSVYSNLVMVHKPCTTLP